MALVFVEKLEAFTHMSFLTLKTLLVYLAFPGLLKWRDERGLQE